MNPIQHFRRIAAVLAGLAAALTAFGATPALAKVLPEPGGAVAVAPPAPATAQVHAAAGGVAIWQVVLIAVAAALAGAALAMLADRARGSRRRAITAAV